MARRIGGAGGGSDPGPGGGKSGPVVAGAVLAGVIAAAGGGGATASVGAALDSATASSTDAQTADGERAAGKGNETEAWRRMALRQTKTFVKRELRCALQSYGEVQQFFLRTPCNSLNQRLVAFLDTHGNTIVVSVVWVKMSSAEDAASLKTVEDTYGTGDITPIATDVLRLGGIRFTGKHYQSRRDGALVVVAETEPAQGHPSTTLLDDAAKVAAVLPPP